ncbi:hypothetical protein ES703_77090 [subsurface metagenome]
MKTKMVRVGSIILMVALVLVMTGCPGRTEQGFAKSLGFTIDRGFRNDCQLGSYAALCWTLDIEDQNINMDADYDNPLLIEGGFPTGDEPGRITGLVVEGKYTGKIKIRISPAILLGPPLCALSSPINGPSIATTVVDFKITGDYEWVWGDGYVAGNALHTNVLISKSNLHIDVFDVHNLWDGADAELKKYFKNTIRRSVDKQVVASMNEVFALGDTPPSDLPVYISREVEILPGLTVEARYNPYSDGGFCSP